MSHIFTDDGKQWYLIPELPQLMEVQGQAGHIIIAENQRRMDEAKDNALPIVNQEVIETVYPKPYPGLYEWPGTWEKELVIHGEDIITSAKLIAPQQPQAQYKCQACGTTINEGEFKTFGVCDNCYDASYKKQTAMTQSDAPQQ